MRNRGSLPVLRLAPVLWLAACAGSTVGSGVGDAVLTRPPYAAGRQLGPGAVITHLPIEYVAGASNPEAFDPSAHSAAVTGLLEAMNARTGSLLGQPLPTVAMRGTPPDVRFGCVTSLDDECDVDGPVRGGRREMHLAVSRPSTSWKQWLTGALRDEGATHALVLTIEIADYWPRQKNLLGTKEIELGSGYAMPLPWLTGLDRPVSVIQLTGALVDSTGRAVRIGAEGMLARRTDLLLGSIGAQVLITEADVAALRTAAREDLPGRPLVWEAAIDNLIETLTGLDAARMANGAEPARTVRNPLGRQ